MAYNMQAQQAPILSLEGVKKCYKDFTLGPLDLALPAGCITGFIGENGAGKSTTMNLILGLVRPDGGHIKLNGRADYLTDPAVFEQLGVVLDICGIHEAFTLTQINRIMSGIFHAWDQNEFLRYCERFQLPARKKLRAYSHGMRRKLNLAVALSHNARFLILDEPTSGLDPVVRDELLDVFLEFMQNDDRAIFLSSHILSDLEKACDYIAFLHQGKLLLFEQKDALCEKYCVVKCDEAGLRTLDPACVHGVRRNRFGVEALVDRAAVGFKLMADPASMEDIMLFYIREGDGK